MTDALASDAITPQTDALIDDQWQDTPIAVKPQENDPAPEVKKSPSREDAVRKAMDDALGKDDGEEKPEVKKEAKAEEKPKEEAKPDDKPAKDRAEDGKFKAKVEPDADADPSVEAKTKPTAYKEAPGGFDDAAKKEWEATPESVRGAVHRRTKELESGIEKYRGVVAEYEPVRQYAEMAKASGTTLDAALKNYVGAEQLLRTNPIVGLESIVANLGLKGQNGQPITFRQIAQAYLQRTPEQAQNASLQAQVQMMQRQQQEQAQVMQRNQAMTAAQTEWQAWSGENHDAAQYEDAIAEVLREYPANANIPIKKRLSDAWAIVKARNPSAAHPGAQAVAHTDHAPETATSQKPNPAGQLGIRGAPGGKPTSQSRKLSRSEAVEKAMRAAGL